MKTRKELEEMMSDYIFARLSNSEAEEFEQSINQYPDLLQEVEDAKVVFANIDEMDIDGFLENKTRNLSVRVNQKLQKKKIKHNSSFLFKYALPTAVAITLILFWVQRNDSIITNLDSEIKFSQKLNESVSQIFDENDKVNNNNLAENNQHHDEALEDSKYQSLSLSGNEKVANYTNTEEFYNDYYLEDDIGNLSEEQIQTLILEIENVKI